MDLSTLNSESVLSGASGSNFAMILSKRELACLSITLRTRTFVECLSLGSLLRLTLIERASLCDELLLLSAANLLWILLGTIDSKQVKADVFRCLLLFESSVSPKVSYDVSPSGLLSDGLPEVNNIFSTSSRERSSTFTPRF